uniref:Hepcidin n=1 Tax=Chrysemys picta bellii TaxID=8478 RepID=A0A8C3I436_CHRPI
MPLGGTRGRCAAGGGGGALPWQSGPVPMPQGGTRGRCAAGSRVGALPWQSGPVPMPQGGTRGRCAAGVGWGLSPGSQAKRHNSHFPICTYCCKCCRNQGCGFCCRT